MAWHEDQDAPINSAPAAGWHEDQDAPAEIGQKATAGTMSPADTAKFLRENPDLAGWEPGGAKIRAAQAAAQPRTVDTTGGLGATSQQDTAKVAAPVAPAPAPDLSPKNAVQRAYQTTRTALSYPAAVLTTGIDYLASHLSRHYPGTPELPTLGEIYGQTQAEGARGEGFTGLLADPINAAAVATQFIPGFDIPGAAWLASKAPLVARAAELAAANPVARSIATGAAKDAGWSGAQNLMDPNLQYTPLGESMAAGAVLGGATGGIGAGLQRWGLKSFPGLNPRYNAHVPDDAKALVQANLENILREGVLPKTREGLMHASERRQLALGSKYDEALNAVEQAHPDMLIPTADWAKGANDQLVKDLGYFGRAGLIEAPGTKLGFSLPDQAKTMLNDKFTRVRGTKINQLQNEIESIHDLINFGNKHFPYDPTLPASRSATQASLAREWSKDEAIPAISKAKSTEVQARVDLKDPVKSQLPGMIDDIVNSYRSPDAAKLGPVASQRLHDWIAKDLTPKQLSDLRTALSDPSMYRDPIAEVAVLKRDVGHAIHQAATERLMQIPEYKVVMGNAVKDNKLVFKKGSVPQKYKLEMNLQNVIEHPGSIGLSDRLNLFGLLNPAVSPWLKASTLYKGGGLLKAAGLTPFMTDEARQLYDIARNKP